MQAIGPGGRAVVPNYNSLTAEQRQAFLAQQQRLLSDANRQILTRPAPPSHPQAVGPTAGILGPRVMLQQPGPVGAAPGVLLPTLRGLVPVVSAAPAASKPPVAVASATAASATSHRAEKRKYDALRFFYRFFVV